ncbi:MAG: hypothetical protein D6696_10685 [Acidobacteria bacterium]|nr:MAG: hypothetical protein D6696_10685 [Acidobacteriota bacterium]
MRRDRPRLRADGRLRSELWLDRDDAHRRIDKRLRRGTLDGARAEKLRQLVEHGHLRFTLDLDEAQTAAIDGAADALWRDRPADVAYACRGLPIPFAYGDGADRRPPYRIADLHTACDAALRLALDPTLFEWVELIFGAPAVAVRSFYFEWGSQELLHRDPMRVPVSRPHHLLTAWIALEDVTAESGPVTYIPGSHRWPFYQLTPSRMLVHRPHASPSAAWDAAQWQRVGVEPEVFTARRGEVLLWHHGLLHGGARPRDPERSRKSLVVHFSTRATMRRLRLRYQLPAADGTLSTAELTSDRLLELDGRCAFDSPLRVHGLPAAAQEPAPALLSRPALQHATML